MTSSLRFSAFVGMGLLLAGSASGADIASILPIGFSPDGKVFAYEEYGIQDGSGFPYANIYAIDLDKDTFLPGTPFRVRIDDETATLAKARWKVRDEAETIIEAHELTHFPGEFVAFNPITEVTGDPHRLRYRSIPVLPFVGEPNTLVLEEIPQPAPPECEGMIEKAASFRLRYTEQDGKPENRLIYEDTRLPASRRCVTGYRLAGIVSGAVTGGVTVEVALVLVLSAGFEGQDGRWIAIPVKTAP